MLDKLIEIDINLFLWLNSFHSSFFDSVMWFISGKKEWIPLYVALLVLIIYRFKAKSVWIIISIALVIACSDIISTQVFKHGIERFRPSHNPDIIDQVHLVNNYHGGKFGFVSSHAANSFGLAMFISLLFNHRKLTIFMFIWATVVSYSRIYLGVHYPGDILGGALLGAGFGFLLHRLFQLIMTKYIIPKSTRRATHEQTEN